MPRMTPVVATVVALLLLPMAALAQTPWDLPDSGGEWTAALIGAGVLLVVVVVVSVVMAVKTKRKNQGRGGS